MLAWVRLIDNAGSTYQAFLIAFSQGGLYSAIIADRQQRNYILPWDSARASQLFGGVRGSGHFEMRNSREHEEFFSPDIGEVWCEWIIGLKWPDITSIAPPTGSLLI